MANEEHLAKLKDGVKAWNEWRDAQGKMHPDLRGANLEGADLKNARLSEADLGEANLSGADLSFSDLGDANLHSANLRYAQLRSVKGARANLRFADLSYADFRGTKLTGAELQRATLGRATLRSVDLTQADVTGSLFGWTVLADTNLTAVKGLESIQHFGPSTIGIDTIYQSSGIPLTFLRGAGVPEIFIEYGSSLVARGAIQFYSCFISYSTKDQEFAERLHADLQNKGVRCWFAPHDIQGGKKVHEQIDEAIRRYERLLLILSQSSMSSKWVKTEIRNARKRELAEKKRVLFPVRLASYEVLRDWKVFDADEGEDLATEIREYYIPDFSEWKSHDPYQREFEKLLRDLRTEGAKSA
jgi:hypothetical protein